MTSLISLLVELYQLLRVTLISLLTLTLYSPSLLAEEHALEYYPDGDGKEQGMVVIPVAAALKSTGMMGGAVVSVPHIGQANTQLVGFGAYSVNDSYITYLGYFNFALTRDWSIDVSMLQAEFMDSPLQGSTDSVDASKAEYPAAYLERDWYLTLRRNLPTLRARTDFEFEPFYKTRDIRSNSTAGEHGKSYGVSAGLVQDTRDNQASPGNGYLATGKVLRDWGGAERAAYTRWEAQYARYLDLGGSALFKQQTLALSAYLSDIPTWSNHNTASQPDWFAQSVLGGSERMRGYEDDYFHSRSAVHYAAEYRVIPQWQPQSQIPLVNRYQFPWWQVALFAELGDVAPHFSLEELHSDLKWSAGFGVRVFVENIVARADFAFSDVDTLFRFAVNQPF
ncbi:BamA/TamA family outer membrane protein [Aliagarivorans taiwanensis]|uniref:BamA/TamA family outer membrane protein n=1 Tax=Aliagarivorans taiwanensis TaxID=561966 RepID=UPI0003F54E9D|nr:BamA/TamA family outer membrane protein [Aliagarivorans taiwanensis]